MQKQWQSWEIAKNCLSNLWDIWKDKPFHREVLLRSQCSQQTISPAQKTGKTKSGPRKSQSKWLERNNSGCSPKFELKMPRLHSLAAIDRPETTKFPPIQKVVWQEPQETHLNDIHIKSTNNIQRKNDVETQTEPIKETSTEVSGSHT